MGLDKLGLGCVKTLPGWEERHDFFDQTHESLEIFDS
jgi:hypothetical protein